MHHAMRQPTPLQLRIDRFRGELVSFLARRGPDPEDLAQEVLLRLAVAGVELPSDADFRAYMYTIARRLLVDRHRRSIARPRLVALDAEPRAAHGPDAQVEAAATLAIVERELAAMRPEIAEVFRWRLTEDVSFAEIAERQGVPLNTALGRMHRAVQRLAAALKGDP